LNAQIPEASGADKRIPKECDRIIQRCLAKSAKLRIEDARTLGLAADGLLSLLENVASVRQRNSSRPVFESFARRTATEEDVPLANASGMPATKPEAAHHWYVDELLASQQAALANWLQSDSTRTLVLLGERGSGRTTLAKKLIGLHAGTGVAVYFDGSTLQASGASDERFEHCIGVSSPNLSKPVQCAKGLFECINRFDLASDRTTLIVIDIDIKLSEDVGKCAPFVLDDLPPKHWKLLVTDTLEHRHRWTRDYPTWAAKEVVFSEIPRLDFQQSLNCATNCFEIARANEASYIIVTPDALLLAAYRGNGNLGRISRIAKSVLCRAALEKRHVISSWDMWLASQALSPNEDSAMSTQSPNARPVRWPSPPVLEILNQCRATCGMHPRR